MSDKIGNRYEGRIAVWRLLQLPDEQHDSVLARFEQPGDDHFEWWVQRADGSRTYTQVKRQQAPDKEWTIGTLVSRGVLTAFGERLGQEPSARCEFFSALSASHLQDLTESAPMATDLAEFEARFAAAAGKRASWDELDQVDAFGAGSGRNPARLEAVAETLREARALSVRVLLACRAFDLEVDPRLADLAGVTGPGRHAEGHHVERLGPVPAADVDQALHDAGISPGTLDTLAAQAPGRPAAPAHARHAAATRVDRSRGDRHQDAVVHRVLPLGVPRGGGPAGRRAGHRGH